MKKNLLYTLGVLLSSGAILTACSSDDGVSESVSNKIEAGKTYYMTVNAARQADTRALTEDDSGINATWATSDNIYVLYNGSSIGTLHPNVAAIEANLSGYINSNESVSLPADIPILFPRAEIDYTGQIGTLENIAEKYDYAKATPHFSKTSNTISAAKSVVFSNQQAIVRFTLTDDKDNNSLNVSSLRISATDLKETGDRTGDITIITPTSSSTNVLYAALSGISNTQVTLTAKVGDTYYVYRKNGVTFADGKFYDIPVQMRALIVGRSLTEIDPGYIGWVVGSDGMVYPADAVPSGTTAVAMVAYVYKEANNIHGLAIALDDEAGGNKLTQSEAATAASEHKPDIKDSTWRLPSRDDWKKMFIGCGNGASIDEYKVNYTCFNSKLETVGGTTFLAGATYWSSSVSSHYLSFDGKEVDMTNTPYTDASYNNVRACLSW